MKSYISKFFIYLCLIKNFSETFGMLIYLEGKKIFKIKLVREFVLIFHLYNCINYLNIKYYFEDMITE